ncbi:growth hormone receptor b [Melanotaenia boesemani]|uniref:growth hormone receptor b n=1 Tax=Melanotaenia boesemani TaxID=1250792 RepID=UPI001C03FC29|nr:growth hormone receptor b [Melanotaenia boesemani]
MAAALIAPFFLLLILTGSAVHPDPQKGLLPQRPHLTGCISNNMETFRCRWNGGTFRNVSEPGDLRVFFVQTTPLIPSLGIWSECPHYSTERSNECFFNENHTTVWVNYRIQLRSRDQAVVYDEIGFEVQDIVQPDPPVSLNWTLLNMSLTSVNYDIIVSWKPPQSADVETGWMTLQYEVQYRRVNSDLWEVTDLVKSTHRSLFGLQTNTYHEVRVRCKMLAGKHFGEFSESMFVHIPCKVSRVPGMALLIFGALVLVTILMLVIISQQEKLMVILLPPVPGPKIRGIDPELLKKGKLRELTSILGGPPDLRPELYNNDPWVEFIDLDIEEPSDRLTDLDTDCLMDPSLSSNCSPLSIGFRDDDSGRSSCCDPDLLSDSNASPLHPPIPNQMLSKDLPCQTGSKSSSGDQGSPSGEPSLVAQGKEAMYAQVSEVRSSGNVLLSPEEQTEVETNTSKDKDVMVEKGEEKNEVQLLVVNADSKDYTSELTAGSINPESSPGGRGEPFQTGVELNSSLSRSPHCESDTVPMSLLPPAPVYTVVEGVDRQNSLFLTPNPTPGPILTILKTMPTPDGYVTPDVLGSITP